MTREEWLNKAANMMRPWFQEIGLPLPEKLRVSVGWPTTGALAAPSSKSRTIGQCFSNECSEDKTTEVFISPYVGKAALALSTLAHELVHAGDNCKHGHGPVFKKYAVALGLEGKMTATNAGPALTMRLEQLVNRLGDYPHASLDLSKQKKQTTRLLKATCEGCGYVIRLTQKWADVGLPTCCCGEEFRLEEPEEEGE